MLVPAGCQMRSTGLVSSRVREYTCTYVHTGLTVSRTTSTIPVAGWPKPRRVVLRVWFVRPNVYLAGVRARQKR